MCYIWKRRKTVYHVIEARQTMKHVQSVESAIFPSRVEVLTLPYMVWRVWLTEILETFQRVFRFEKSRIKENGGKHPLHTIFSNFHNFKRLPKSLFIKKKDLKNIQTSHTFIEPITTTILIKRKLG